MNQEQIKSGVRWALTTFGGVLTGFAVGKGWVTTDQAASFVNSETVVGVITFLVTGAWGIWVRSKVNMVAATEKLPGVAGVVTAPTQEGREIAAAVPSPNVASAGTPEAQRLAS